MANVYLQDSTLTAIGNAIRAKAGNTTQLLPSEMAAAITSLPSGGADELKVIQSLDEHVVVSANGADALRNEHNQAYGVVTAPTASVIPLAAMGLQGYENFMKNCIYLRWQGTAYASNTSTMKYSSSVECHVIPALGSYQNRYVYGLMLYAKQQMTSGGSVSNYSPFMVSEGLGTNRPSFVLDTVDGTLHAISHSIGSGGSMVNPKIGGAYSKGQTSNMAIYYKKKL